MNGRDGRARRAVRPDGAFVAHGGRALLVLDGRLIPWSPAGYEAAVELDPAIPYRLLTPPTSLRALTGGYPVTIHPEALSPPRPA